jgi:MFS family permease
MNEEIISKDKAKIIVKILGILQLAIGFFSLGIAPLEIYSFYLFSEGGRFYYDGFGIGSFLYGLIFAQIIGYYFIAFLFICIGYGHLRLKKWTLKLSKSSIWFWILFGLPIMVFFLPLLSMKEIDVKNPVLLLTFIVLLFIVVIPGLLLSFYNQKSVKELFKNKNYSDRGIHKKTINSLLLLLVYILHIMIFHIMIFYKGIFPFFGRLLVDFNGIFLNSLCIFLMFLLVYGLIKRKYWFWIISIIFFVSMSISSIMTLISYQYIDIIKLLDFPKLENDLFIQLPLKSSYFLIVVLWVLLITTVVIFKTKNYYKNAQYSELQE